MGLLDKVYELPLSKSYVQHWGVVEAVRELLQNALDSDSPMEWGFSGDRLWIRSANARLSPRTLLLGTTSKSEDSDKVGQFGEGYKIAMLVLIRIGYGLSIQNNELLWCPEFRYSKTFEEDVLVVREYKEASGRGKGLTFSITGLSEDDIERIKASCLLMQPVIGEVIDTSKGRILLDRPGQLFVKGLFVCETGMQFGYDMKPEFLKLERDRQTVSSFDLAFLTKEMWFETGRNDQIVELMEAEVPDLQYAQYSTPAIVKEACYQHFLKKNPGAICVENNKELKEKVAQGMTVYVSGGSYGAVVRSHPEHSARAFVAVQTPQQYLAEWFSANRSEMRTKAIVAFKDLLAEAGKWSKK